MIITRAYKFRLYPTKSQEHLINSFIGTSRFVYNHYLYLNKTKKFFNYFDASKDIKNLKEENKWLNEVDGCLIQNALKDLEKAYLNYNKGQSGQPKFKKKSISGSYRTTAIRSSYKGKNYCNIEIDLERKVIKLPKLKEVSIRGYRKLMTFPHKILNATISKEANRYYVSVCCEENIEEKESNFKYAVGLDLGVKTLVTTSDGIKYGKIDISKEEKRIAKLNKHLGRQNKGSNNYNKTVIKLEREYQKIRNKRKHITHKITTTLVKENDLIITETLKVKEMIEKGKNKLSKYIINSSLSEIIRQLKYKTAWNSKRLMQIDTYFASSQICNHCGSKNKEVKDLSVRKWICPMCKSELDRDINASINILYEGLIKYYKEITSV